MRWDVGRADHAVILRIVDRAAAVGLVDSETGDERLDLVMDLTAVHLNDAPLDLPAFLAGDTFDFNHDIAGIQRHINRRTGKLGGCFVPRFAQGQEARRD